MMIVKGEVSDVKQNEKNYVLRIGDLSVSGFGKTTHEKGDKLSLEVTPNEVNGRVYYNIKSVLEDITANEKYNIVPLNNTVKDKWMFEICTKQAATMLDISPSDEYFDKIYSDTVNKLLKLNWDLFLKS